MGWTDGVAFAYLLFGTHPPALFQIRPRAETVVDFAREYQHPGPGSCHPSRFPSASGFIFIFSFFCLFPSRGELVLGFFLHGVDFGGEFGEQLARNGVAGAGVVETEHADVAEVRGGDVVGFEEGGGRGGGGGAELAVWGAFERG